MRPWPESGWGPLKQLVEKQGCGRQKASTLMITTIDVNKMVAMLQVDVYLASQVPMMLCKPVGTWKNGGLNNNNSHSQTKSPQGHQHLSADRPRRQLRGQTTTVVAQASASPPLRECLRHTLEIVSRLGPASGTHQACTQELRNIESITTFSLSVHQLSSPHKAQTCCRNCEGKATRLLQHAIMSSMLA